MYECICQIRLKLFAFAMNEHRGTPFSIIHRKPFAARPIRGNMSRIEDLLEMAVLSGRIATDPNGLATALNRPIDCGRVSMRIDHARSCPLAFLRDAVVCCWP